jgi:lysophospholipase L1-like esterase
MIAREFYSKIHECGIKYNLPVVSVNEYWEEKISAGIKHSSLVQADGIHPNEKGYQLMAEAVFEIF